MPVAERSRMSTAEASVAIVAGLALLLVRPVVAGRPVLMAGILATIFAISLVAPLPGTSAPAFAWVPSVLLLGVGAIAAARFLPGARVPLPVSGTAVLLNSMAAIAEEAFFRRLLYGRLAPMGAGVAIAGSALLFALIHVPIYGVAVFWVDLGAGLLFGWQRWASGRWDVPATTHVVANLLAVMR